MQGNEGSVRQVFPVSLSVLFVAVVECQSVLVVEVAKLGASYMSGGVMFVFETVSR